MTVLLWLALGLWLAGLVIVLAAYPHDEWWPMWVGVAVYASGWVPWLVEMAS